jgi:hypothetical protein
MTLRVLQMNLCDSGIAACYTGRSVAEAAAVIRAQRPDIVTLNEVCRDDVSVLEHTLSDGEHGSVVTRAFQAALDQRTGDPVRCRNGQQYGIGLLAGVRAPYRGFTTFGGRYLARTRPTPRSGSGSACTRSPISTRAPPIYPAPARRSRSASATT